jgi:hypothetical protein
MKAIHSHGIPSDQMTIFYALVEYEALLKQNRNSYQIQQFLDRNFLSRSTQHDELPFGFGKATSSVSGVLHWDWCEE